MPPMINPFAAQVAAFPGDPGMTAAGPTSQPMAAIPQAAMPATPQMPSFGTPPIAPAPPQMPAFNEPRFDINQPRRGGPNFLQGMLPILAAAIAGGKDPAAIGAGLASYMQGKRLRDRERLDARELARKEQAEAAEFYSRALSQSQTIDDPVAFEQWQRAIGPVAQVHGINPSVFTFNNQKALTREKSEAATLLEKLDKQHPDGNYTADWKGKRITRAELAKFAGQSAFDPTTGNPLNPYVKPNPAHTPNTPQEADIADALEIAEKKKGAPLTAEERQKVRRQAIGDYAKLNDRPVDPALAEIRALTAANLRAAQQNGGLSPGQFNQAKSLADDFTRDVKDYSERRRAYQTVLSAADNAAGDVSLIFAFMKMLDPGSVVRENEYATAQNAAGIPERIRNAYNQAISGRRLGADQRTQFTAQAQEIYNGAKAEYQDVKAIYDERATTQGIDPKFVTFTLPDPTGPSQRRPAPAGPQKAGATPNPATTQSALDKLNRRRKAKR